MEIITEQSTKIYADTGKTISKKLDVFYNPIMKLNRDISVLLLNAIKKKDMQIADIMAGSGIRSIRFLKELEPGKIKTLFINDYKKNFYNNIKNNFKLNKIISNNTDNSNNKIINNYKIILSNEDANLFLLNSRGFDYIDIDPFGTPNYFLDTAIKRISRDGILAVTATDTAALTGTHELVTNRKYWAKSMKNEMMHELGIRILIRKVQIVGAQYEKALIPLLSFADKHYYRIFFQCIKGKKEVDKVIREHKYFLYNPKNVEFNTSEHNLYKNSLYAGPLWVGNLSDFELISLMLKLKNINSYPEAIKLLELLKEESKINIVGFYDVHKIVKNYKIKSLPKKEIIITEIRKKGFNAFGTHFSGHGIKSNIDIMTLIKIIKELVKKVTK
ncbi:MAG: hypothetical protein QXG00_05570 [Candidatus Woesearchaeota archaeon]